MFVFVICLLAVWVGAVDYFACFVVMFAVLWLMLVVYWWLLGCVVFEWVRSW